MNFPTEFTEAGVSHSFAQPWKMKKKKRQSLSWVEIFLRYSFILTIPLEYVDQVPVIPKADQFCMRLA